MSIHDKQNKKQVLIIWAWPAGLTLWYELVSRSDEFDVTIIEKQQIIWGLAQTYNHKGNRIDIGWHRFFSKSQRVMDRWFDKMPLQGEAAWDYKELDIETETATWGPIPDNTDTVMLARRRLSRIFRKRRFFDYPLSITWDTIKKFGFVDLVLSGRSYFIARFKKFDQSTLDGFFKARFGERLYKRFFHTYTWKVRGKRPFQISASRGAQRVKKLDLGKAVWDYFKKLFTWNKQSTQTETSLIGKFYYPKLGPGQIWEIVAEKFKAKGGKIVMGAGFQKWAIKSPSAGRQDEGWIPGEYSIERAILEDAEEIYCVKKESRVTTYSNEVLGITPEMIRERFDSKEEKHIQTLKKFIADWHPIWIVKNKGKIVGIKYGSESDGNYQRIWAIYILREHHGKWIGKALMKISLVDYWEQDLYCEVTEYNTQAIGFYKYFGFEIDLSTEGKGVVFGNGVKMNTIVMKRNGIKKIGQDCKEQGASVTISSLQVWEVIYWEIEWSKTTLEPDIIVSTMPIKDLLNGLEGADPEVVRLSNNLEYRDFITVGILAKKLLVTNESAYPTINNIIPDNRLYIHDEGTTVGRIQIFNNWSPYLVKDRDTVRIGLEYFCAKGEELWNKPDEEMIEFAIAELERMKLLDRADFLDGVVRRMEYAYPCYFGEWYEKFTIIRDYLDSISNLYCIGRNGAHRYNNQDHSMLSAMRLADMLVEEVEKPRSQEAQTAENIIYDENGVDRNELWNINTEEEYHEKS